MALTGKEKKMQRAFAVTAAIALLCLGSLAQATIIQTVPVGNPGNVGELSGAGAGGYGPDRICGSVSYAYHIGKYEVTAGQYTAFLNAVAKTDTYGLYNTYMDTANSWDGCNIKRSGSSGNYNYTVGDGSQTDLTVWGNRPVNYVSYWDSCRFANWLGNGQGSGDTENGAYTLNGYNGGDGRTIGRNAGATWAVTSEDEWYKAAYYKGGGTSAGYWLYPTQNNTAPGRDLADASGNNANYYGNPYPIQWPYYTTVVGEFQNSDSAYGTFDQGGNVWEWNEAIILESYRGLRGGSFYINVNFLQSSVRNGCGAPPDEYGNIGFRVSVVPEPSSIIALAGGLISLLGLKRRRV